MRRGGGIEFAYLPEDDLANITVKYHEEISWISKLGVFLMVWSDSILHYYLRFCHHIIVLVHEIFITCQKGIFPSKFKFVEKRTNGRGATHSEYQFWAHESSHVATV